MIDNISKKIEKLIEEGNSFNKFADKQPIHRIYKSISGGTYYPIEDYEKWKARAEHLIISKFGLTSSVYSSFKEGEEILDVQKDFEKGHGAIMRSLQAAYTLCEHPKKKKISRKKATSQEITEIKRDEISSNINKNKLFIIHGNDEKLKDQLEEFITEIGLEPIVLHQESNDKLTIIEKCEKYTDVQYAIVILTPDEISYLSSEEKIPDEKRRKEMKAMQQIIWEFGFLVGKFGNKKVCCFYTEGVTLPIRIPGIIYKKIENGIDEARFLLMSEVKTTGFISVMENKNEKNNEELRRKLDDDYIENRISREEYLKKKKRLIE